MSEPIPESIPTSADPRSRRPVKRLKPNSNPNASAIASQANAIENLMWDPDRPVNIPSANTESKSSSLPAPPEIVANVQGSSAGAGSGEFHVYKASRRREYERLKIMDEEAKKEDEDKKWEEVERERKEKDEEKTRKNREKRNKKKGKKGGSATTNGIDNSKAKENGDSTGADGGSEKKVIQIPRRGSKEDDGHNDFAVAEVVKENGITIHDDD